MVTGKLLGLAIPEPRAGSQRLTESANAQSLKEANAILEGKSHERTAPAGSRDTHDMAGKDSVQATRLRSQVGIFTCPQRTILHKWY